MREDVWLHYGLRWLVLAVLCHTSCHSCRRRLIWGCRGHGRCHRCSHGVPGRLHRAWQQRNKASTHHYSNHNNISSTNISGRRCWKSPANTAARIKYKEWAYKVTYGCLRNSWAKHWWKIISLSWFNMFMMMFLVLCVLFLLWNTKEDLQYHIYKKRLYEYFNEDITTSQVKKKNTSQETLQSQWRLTSKTSN